MSIANQSFYENGVPELSPQSSIVVPANQESVIESSESTPEVEIPNLDDLDLDALLAATSEEVTLAEMTEREVSSLLTERESLINRRDNVQTIAASRRQRIAAFDPLQGVTPQSYQRLAELNITQPATANRMEQVAAVLARIEQLPSTPAQVATQREQLQAVRTRFESEMDTELVGRNVDISIRRGRAKNTAANLYRTRLNELEQQIGAIEANPRISELLNAQATAAAEAETEQARIAQETATKEYSRLFQSVSARQNNAVASIARLLNRPTIDSNLLSELAATPRLLSSIRQDIINGIIQNPQTIQPSDLIPWITQKKGIDYIAATKRLDELTVPTQFTAQYEQAILLNNALRILIGSKWLNQPNGKRPILSAVYQAFNTRAMNDRTGETARIQAEIAQRAEAARLEAEVQVAERAAEIEAFIAAGGFSVRVPIYASQMVDGKRQQVHTGYRDGAIRLSRSQDRWTVAALDGYTGNIKIGQSSPLSMQDFPSWMREAADNCFAMQGTNYVERVIYEQ